MKAKDGLPTAVIDRLRNFESRIGEADLVIRAMPYTYLFVCSCSKIHEVMATELGHEMTCNDCKKVVVPF